MKRVMITEHLYGNFIKPLGLFFVCCGMLVISACANQNYRKAEDLYQNARYNEAYTYIEQALKDNPESEEYLKLEVKIRKGMYHRNFLGLE